MGAREPLFQSDHRHGESSLGARLKAVHQFHAPIHRFVVRYHGHPSKVSVALTADQSVNLRLSGREEWSGKMMNLPCACMVRADPNSSFHHWSLAPIYRSRRMIHECVSASLGYRAPKLLSEGLIKYRRGILSVVEPPRTLPRT